jgi:hypothetical protein
MNENLLKISKEEIAKLPFEQQTVINSFNWGEIANQIGIKYLLGINEINKLQTEVLLVLIKMERIDDLSINIENNINVSEEKSKNISDEIIKQIFNPIAIKMDNAIKNKIQTQNPKWDQRVNFIISGGDYSYFIEK